MVHLNMSPPFRSGTSELIDNGTVLVGMGETYLFTDLRSGSYQATVSTVVKSLNNVVEGPQSKRALFVVGEKDHVWLPVGSGSLAGLCFDKCVFTSLMLARCLVPNLGNGFQARTAPPNSPLLVLYLQPGREACHLVSRQFVDRAKNTLLGYVFLDYLLHAVL